jgi:transposase
MKSTKKSNIYSAEFRESAVKLAIESGQPKSATAREMGINVNTLHTWISKYHQDSRPEPKQIDDMHLYDQLKALKKENQKLKEERDILKKAAAYFASHSL